MEGNFRSMMSRLRSHAESIAFFGGGPREGSLVDQCFRELLKHLRTVIDIRSGLISGDKTNVWDKHIALA